ncbi:hypothetical protein L3Y34_008636 [Caenorhabditis briggsae]|uniref:Uncharacterized protein n=1 Tax=Caenorhabditis briggsae TaxID=6238 RepID=A0AAE9A7X1_CAEBR|nr:hypothetical protein L3Y34_008636 [Caenorhabditis briggsae]
MHFFFLLFLPFTLAVKDLAWYSSSTGLGSSSSVIHSPLQAATAIDFCQLPVDIGKCSQQLVRYYYDPAVDECKRFTFSGCGGNSNRFMRRAHCRNRCVKQPNKLVTVQELKHRRTVTTTTPADEKKVEETEKDIDSAKNDNGVCQGCDPLYGTCIDGKCGCMKGFRPLGKVCIDLNECDNGAVCGANARCVNEIGSFQCVCDAGFSIDGDCKIGQEACMDEFDVNLTEEDCNNGKQEIKYYYDAETVQCKQFFYGGCKTKSRNFFADLQTCDIVCVSSQRDYIQSNGQSLHHPTHQISSDLNGGYDLKSNHYKIDLFSSPSSPVRPDRPLSVDDWPLKPVTLKPALDLDFSVAHTKSVGQKMEEAEKAEELVRELTPDHNICELKFEPVLREECISADWSEKFFWNSDFRDCEPFWYDSSCDPRDRAGKNFFESFDDCKKKCDGGQGDYVVPIEKEKEDEVEERVEVEEEEPVEEEIVPEETTTPTTTTTTLTKSPEDEHSFFFKVKPQNYLEDVLSTEKDEDQSKQHHNGFNPNEFLKQNAKKVETEELKKIIPKQEETTEATKKEEIEHSILEELKKEEPVEKVLAAPTTCDLEYDADLRNECTSADWNELFYWNEQFKECEAFWYDSSCGEPDFEKKNIFKNYEDCNNKCVKKIGETAKKIATTTTATTTTSTTTTTTTTASPTTSSVLLEETKRPNYKQTDPLNLILNKALKPDESSELPEKFPPNHEKTFVNFAIKSEVTATTKFDRLKYMAEFRKKLLALPDNFSTPGKPSTPTSAPTTKKKIDPTTHEITEKQSTSTASTQTTTTTTFNDFVEAEKKKVLETIKILDRPEDLCDEPLHPKLEEDCKNDQWEIKWFFNSDRGACKSFWYGGCEVESRNFFPDHANCRHTCAHKYGTPASFSSKVYIPPGGLSTPIPPRKDRLTTSLKLTYPHSEDLFPEQKHRKVVELDGNFQRLEEQRLLRLLPTPSFKTKGPLPTAGNIVNVSEGDKAEIEPAFYSHIDRVVHDMKSGGHPGYTKPEEFVRRIESASNDYIKYDFQKPEVVTIIDKSPPTVPTITWMEQTKQTTPLKSEPTNKTPTTRSINDPCDDEYDPKWDEDCLGDSWVVRSYYDAKAKACKAFWYGGCHTSSRNIWFDKETCRTSCAHKFATDFPMTGEDHSKEVISSSSEIQESSTSSSSSSDSASSNTAHVSPEHRFKLDLDQKLADIKRDHEGREDLAYSKMVDHPVTVAAECLESFNETLSKPCGDGKTWSNRYYYDKDTRSCRMFWSNGCFSSSKNNFDDQETCQWKCEGRHPQPAGKSCLDKFDERYLEDCRHGEFTNRFYFDHDRKKCVAFHWGGCQSKSQNFFADMTVCQDLCESPPRELTQACIQPFDKNYENSCSAEQPQQYYYFDASSGICKMFWFGNCKGENENIFSTLESCQWICERKREERKPAICADKFDHKYTESCGNSQWKEKWYFDQSSGDCTSFWWDGCTSSSQNIFPDEKSCTSNCKHPGFEISSKLASQDSKFRCLEPVEIGNCQETYPAFYYDRTSRTCRPFAYSGCGGNSNRFMTVSQCENLCFAFNSMNEAEVDCHLPMHIGYGKNEDSCLPQAGFRFYYDRSYGKCSQMWYLGCGGNANNFYSYEICQRTCSRSNQPRELERKTRASSEVCFEAPGDKGICGKNSSSYPLQRWTYGAQKCTSFTYSGCGGNRNRFATQNSCEQTCKGLLNSNDPRICSFPPDWGSCNQLRYVWFYNLTRGTCDQFLYGGCGGNPNRFETFEICQKACEVTGTDPCMESLDRGSWCEAMSNRYYFNKRARQCKGFHYTGCGKSGNNFLTKEECQTKCEKRFPRAAPPSKKKAKVKLPVGYSGSKPKDKTPMLRHINLNGLNQTYFKSEPQWMDYTSCYGYRYNVSGRDTVLNVHYCSIQGSSDCISESYRTTEGEEFCNIIRPFLRGQNLYSFYFGLDSVNPMYRPKDGLSGRIQRKNETIAAILVLRANQCHEIC